MKVNREWLYLLTPPFVTLAAAMALTTGIAKRIATALPYGIGMWPVRNAWIGMLILYLVCSGMSAHAFIERVERTSIMRELLLFRIVIGLCFLALQIVLGLIMCVIAIAILSLVRGV